MEALICVSSQREIVEQHCGIDLREFVHALLLLPLIDACKPRHQRDGRPQQAKAAQDCCGTLQRRRCFAFHLEGYRTASRHRQGRRVHRARRFRFFLRKRHPARRCEAVAHVGRQLSCRLI